MLLTKTEVSSLSSFPRINLAVHLLQNLLKVGKEKSVPREERLVEMEGEGFPIKSVSRYQIGDVALVVGGLEKLAVQSPVRIAPGLDASAAALSFALLGAVGEIIGGRGVGKQSRDKAAARGADGRADGRGLWTTTIRWAHRRRLGATPVDGTNRRG